MGERLAGKTAVVVGGGQTPGETIGNGRATAITFAREGARVLVVDRDGDRAQATVDELAEITDGEGVALAADVATEDGPASVVAAAVEAFGRIDVVHNNVGIGAGDAAPHKLTDEGYDRIMDVNLRATWRMCRAAVPALREARGCIVNVSSLAAIAAAGNLTAYKLSKAGVNALTQNLALTNAKYGVRANAVMPGFIDTPMAVDAPAELLGLERADYAKVRADHVPLGRQGTAWDVANAALFPPPTRRSSSPASSWPSTAARAPSSAEAVRPRRGR
jgi:NAD(P)-dependent dehydrogenase (short-subunit alcohol dehydrogenase family)